MIYLVDGHPELTRIEADTWEQAEAALKGVGVILGELIDECKRASYAGFSLTELKFAQGDGGTREFEGYGAVFNNVDLGGDKIMPGAFTETLANYKMSNRMPGMFYQHGEKGGGPVTPIGVWKAMEQDNHGLVVKGQLADTTLGEDVYKLMKMGAISGLSIGYRVRDAARGGINSDAKRMIKSADLVEVSLVNDPMNPEARLTGIKSFDNIQTVRDVERWLRDAGMTNSQAKAVAAKGAAGLNLRDEGGPDDAKAEALERLFKSIQEGITHVGRNQKD